MYVNKDIIVNIIPFFHIFSKKKTIIIDVNNNISTILLLKLYLCRRKNDAYKERIKYNFCSFSFIFLSVDRYIRYINIGNSSNITFINML